MPQKITITIEGTGNFSDDAKKAEDSLKKLGKAADLFSAKQMWNMAKKTAKATVELYKMGAAAIAGREALQAFAGGSQQATVFLDKFIAGMDGTIDRATATTQVLKMVRSGIITTGEDAYKAGAIILKLGDPLLSTARNAQKFSQMMANTSLVMVDTFGMSKHAVRELAKEFQAMGYTKDEAFELAVSQEADKALALVGDDVGHLKKETDRLDASMTNLKTGFAEGITTFFSTSGVIEMVTTNANKLTATLGQLFTMATAVAAGQRALYSSGFDLKVAQSAFNEAMLKGVGILSEEKEALLASNLAKREAAEAAEAHRVALERETLAAAKQQKRWISLAMSLTSLYRRREREQANFARQAQSLEKAHQRRLQDIRNSAIESEQNREDRRYRQVLARLDAEQAAPLEALRREYGMGEDFGSQKEKLESEHKRRMMGLYTDSARKQEVRRHAAAMKDLEYRTKEAAIISEFEGKKGKALETHESKNQAIKRKAAAALIAEENAAYAAAMANLARSRTEAEQAYNDSLGRMQLQMIDYWESTGQISAEQAMAMRLAVIEQYNLLADEAIVALGRIPTSAFDALEATAGIEVGAEAPAPGTRAEPRGGLGIIGGRGAETPTTRKFGVIGGYQCGTDFHPGGPAMVGEAGPELLNLPRGSSVTPLAGGVTINNYFGPQSVRSDRDIFMIAEAQAQTLRRKTGRVM